MTRWVLRAEGVNFDNTVLDTQDLSTLRGGSLTLLAIHEAVAHALGEIGIKADRIFSGASQCAFRFTSDGDDAAIRSRVIGKVQANLSRISRVQSHNATHEPKLTDPPFGLLTFVVDLVPDRGSNDPVETATAVNRSSQFRNWTVDFVPFEDRLSKRPDTFDRTRPAAGWLHVPEGKFTPLEGDPKDRAPTSASVAARRAFGVVARQRFYERELVDNAATKARLKDYKFADDFFDIVDESPKVSKSLEQKIAVVYADGNGFGKIRGKEYEKFSDTLGRYRKDLLASILNWLIDHDQTKDGSRSSPTAVSGKERALRFETLMWGGDEFVFVMPSWLAVDFVKLFFETTASWTFQSQSRSGGPDKLTHAVGVAIANYKTPIRQLQRIARSAADAAKDAGVLGNSATFEIFESLSPPDIDLGAFRKTIYGESENLAKELAIPGDRFGEFVSALKTLKRGDANGPGFPRSQLYEAIRRIRAGTHSLIGPEADRGLRDHLDAYARRAGGPAMISHLKRNLLPTFQDSGPGPSGTKAPRPTALDMIQIVQFWDYVDPIAEDE